jgi:hypothetical protein
VWNRTLFRKTSVKLWRGWSAAPEIPGGTTLIDQAWNARAVLHSE